jgi:hypothetical protein
MVATTANRKKKKEEGMTPRFKPHRDVSDLAAKGHVLAHRRVRELTRDHDSRAQEDGAVPTRHS